MSFGREACVTLLSHRQSDDVLAMIRQPKRLSSGARFAAVILLLDQLGNRMAALCEYLGRAPESRRLQCVAIAAIGLLLAPYAIRAQTSAPAPAPTTRVYGLVFDSLAMRPLTGALVQLVVATDPSQVRTVTADERGAFAFDDIPKGAYLLGFFHPRLDSLALDTPLLRVDVRAPCALRASLGIPSSSTMVARNCGPNAAKDSLGLFQGRVRQASGGLLAGVGRVRVRWSEIVVGTRGIERTTPSMVLTPSIPQTSVPACAAA